MKRSLKQVGSTVWRMPRMRLSTTQQVSSLFRKKPEKKVLATASPYIWLSEDLDVGMLANDIQDPTSGIGKSLVQTLFDRNTVSAHVTPKEMNYELPKGFVPEIAFVGRSNVGKSTLVGTLLGNSSLVHVSKEPGRTRTINYYSMSNIRDRKSVV